MNIIEAYGASLKDSLIKEGNMSGPTAMAILIKYQVAAQRTNPETAFREMIDAYSQETQAGIDARVADVQNYIGSDAFKVRETLERLNKTETVLVNPKARMARDKERFNGKMDKLKGMQLVVNELVFSAKDEAVEMVKVKALPNVRAFESVAKANDEPMFSLIVKF